MAILVTEFQIQSNCMSITLLINICILIVKTEEEDKGYMKNRLISRNCLHKMHKKYIDKEGKGPTCPS